MHSENRRRLLDWWRDRALRQYWGFEPPAPLMLVDLEGNWVPYVESEPDPRGEGQVENPIGEGPDIHNTWRVLAPDYHPLGAFVQTENGRTYCRIEIPDDEGMMTPRWIQVS